MIRIKATFKGENSLGFLNGREYILNIGKFKDCIVRESDGQICQYGSLHAFLHNWDEISVIAEPMNLEKLKMHLTRIIDVHCLTLTKEASAETMLYLAEIFTSKGNYYLMEIAAEPFAKNEEELYELLYERRMAVMNLQKANHQDDSELWKDRYNDANYKIRKLLAIPTNE